MKTTTAITTFLARTAAMLLLALATSTGAWAEEFITDLMVIGGSESEVNNLKSKYTNEGWTVINKDLNAGCGTSSDYIYLLSKKESNTDGLNYGYITNLYISDVSSTAPDDITYDNRSYHLVPYDGGSHFISLKGDLNSNAGGDYIHLYYTKDPFPTESAVNGITINDNSNGALGKNGKASPAYSLNNGTDGKEIYIHLTTATASPGSQPKSCLDVCDISDNGIRIKGWAYDPDRPNESIKVQAEVRRADGTLYRDWLLSATDKDREDVNNTFYILGQHGFDFIIPIQADDTYTVSVYAIDTPTGQRVQMGNTKTLTVTVKYDLWVGDAQVTWANKDNILDQTDENGKPTAAFSDWKCELMLRNPTINGTHMNSKIYSEMDNLNLDGYYHMTAADADYGLLIDKCNNVESVGSFTFHGRVTGISVKNGARLQVKDTRSDSYLKAVGDSDYGIDGNVQIYPLDCVELQGGKQAWNGQTLTLTNREDNFIGVDMVNGIFKDNQFYEADGTTIARHAVLKPYDFYNLWLGSTQVTEKNQNDILGDGKASFDPVTSTLTLNTSTITGTHAECKIYSKDLDLTIKGNYHMSEAESANGIYTDFLYSDNRSLTLDGNFTFLGTQIGLYGDYAAVTVKSGSLTAKGTYNGVLSKSFTVENGVELVEMEGQNFSALACIDDGVLTFADGYAITSPQGGQFIYGHTYESDGTTFAKYVIIENKNSANPYVAYDVWLGNKVVNSKNKDDIFGDGKASFDPATNTLTLNDPVIPGISYDSKIYSKQPTLTVKGTYHMTTAETIYAFRAATGALTLDGDFTLKGKATHIGESLNMGSPVYAKGDITLKGNINVQGIEDYSAIYSKEGSINILGGNIMSISSAGCAMLCPSGTLTVSSNTTSVTLQGGTDYRALFANVFDFGQNLVIDEPANWEFSSENNTIIDINHKKAANRVVIRGYKLGDVNGDDVVNIVDLALTVSHIRRQNPAGFNSIAADINRDGNIDNIDINAIINIILGKQ